MEQAEVQPKDTTMVGDTLHDLQICSALGIEVIFVDHGHQSAKRLTEAHLT